MILDMPFFMTNEDWYYFDYKEKKYKLTNNAPQKAKESYDEFWKQVKEMNVSDGTKNG